MAVAVCCYAVTSVTARNSIVPSRCLNVTSHNAWMGYQYSLPNLNHQGRFISIIRTPSKQWGVCDDWYALLKSGVITMEMLQSCNKPWFSHRYMIPIAKDQSAIEASLCYPSLSSYLNLNNKNMAVDYKQNFQTHFLKWKFCIFNQTYLWKLFRVIPLTISPLNGNKPIVFQTGANDETEHIWPRGEQTVNITVVG